MTTLAKKFKHDLKEGLVSFAWQQWCRLGITGTSPAKTPWIIDPEVLLAFTTEIGRHDARMFNQVLDWLNVNGSWINTQRLSTIIKKDGVGCPAVMGAVASWLCDRDKSVKWRGIARRNIPGAHVEQEFLFRSVGPKPVIDQYDSHFHGYGLQCEEIRIRDLVKAVDMHDEANIMFKSRALFGIGIRADVMVYLLNNGGGNARQIASLLGYNRMRVHEVLAGLANAGFIRVRSVGKAKHYWIDREQWASILCPEPVSSTTWVNWRPLVRGLTAIWRKAWRLDDNRADAYIISSMMREAMNEAREDLDASGIAFKLTDEKRYVAEDYLPVLAEDIDGILNALSSGVRRIL